MYLYRIEEAGLDNLNLMENMDEESSNRYKDAFFSFQNRLHWRLGTYIHNISVSRCYKPDIKSPKIQHYIEVFQEHSSFKTEIMI